MPGGVAPGAQGGGGGGGATGGQSQTDKTSSLGTITVEYSGTWQETVPHPGGYVDIGTASFNWDEKVTVKVPACALIPLGCDDSASDSSSAEADVVGSPILTVKGTASATASSNAPPDIAAAWNCTSTAAAAPVSPGKTGSPVWAEFSLHQIRVDARDPDPTWAKWSPAGCQTNSMVSGSGPGQVVAHFDFDPVQQINTVLPYTKTYTLSPGSGTATLTVTGNAECPVTAQAPAAGNAQAASGGRDVYSAAARTRRPRVRRQGSTHAECTKLYLFANDVNVTDGSITVAPGQLVWLQARFYPQPPSFPKPSTPTVPNGEDPTEGKWRGIVPYVPGTSSCSLGGTPVPCAVKGYFPPLQVDPVRPLPTEDLTKAKFYLYWLYSPVGQTKITFEGSHNGTQAVASLTVKFGNNFGPTNVTLSATECPVGFRVARDGVTTPPTWINIGAPAVGLGYTDECLLKNGIHWTGKVTATGGIVAYVQMFDVKTLQPNTADDKPFGRSIGDFTGIDPNKLDNSFPYKTDQPTGSAGSAFEGYDNPAANLFGARGTFGRWFSAKLYLIYCGGTKAECLPPSGPPSPDPKFIWVAVAELPWQWSARVACTPSFGGGPGRTWEFAPSGDAGRTPTVDKTITGTPFYGEANWTETGSNSGAANATGAPPTPRNNANYRACKTDGSL